MALLDAGIADRAISRMEEYVAAYPEGSAPVRLRLATTLLSVRLSPRALEQLEALDDAELTEAQREAKRELEGRARAQPDSGRLELE